MRGSALILGLGAPALLAACGGSNPPPVAASVTTSQTSSAMSMSMNTACAPSGTTLKIVAKDTMFDTNCLAAPAGQAVTITFDNKDPLTHNLAIYFSDAMTDPNAEALFKGDLVSGPKTVTYSVPALTAGTYHFHCDVHPTQMYGSFVVK